MILLWKEPVRLGTRRGIKIQADWLKLSEKSFRWNGFGNANPTSQECPSSISKASKLQNILNATEASNTTTKHTTSTVTCPSLSESKHSNNARQGDKEKFLCRKSCSARSLDRVTMTAQMEDI